MNETGLTRRIRQLQDELNALKALLTAKGSLWVATARFTIASLAVGANGTLLTPDSAEATGLKWATLTTLGIADAWHSHRNSVDTGTRTIPDGYSLVVSPKFEVPDGTTLIVEGDGALCVV